MKFLRTFGAAALAIADRIVTIVARPEESA